MCTFHWTAKQLLPKFRNYSLLRYSRIGQVLAFEQLWAHILHIGRSNAFDNLAERKRSKLGFLSSLSGVRAGISMAELWGAGCSVSHPCPEQITPLRARWEPQGKLP